jgi:hypothetical protein
MKITVAMAEGKKKKVFIRHLIMYLSIVVATQYDDPCTDPDKNFISRVKTHKTFKIWLKPNIRKICGSQRRRPLCRLCGGFVEIIFLITLQRFVARAP